jgi:hypothetical protein
MRRKAKTTTRRRPKTGFDVAMQLASEGMRTDAALAALTGLAASTRGPLGDPDVRADLVRHAWNLADDFVAEHARPSRARPTDDDGGQEPGT